MADFIFHDPSGRRAKRTNFGLGIVISLAALMVAGFFATLAFAPNLPNLQMKDPRVLQALHVESAHRLKGRPAWRQIHRPKSTVTGGPVRPLSVGFYVTWDESSRVSLARHVNQLDVVSPEWVTIDGALGRVKLTNDPQAEAIIAGAKTPPSVLPLVDNAHDGIHDGAVASALLLNPAARAALISNLVSLAKSHDYSGYVIDLEDMSPQALAKYPGFVAEARAALKPLGREVWVSVPVANADWDLKAFQAASDTVVLMAYDENWAGGAPGPVAGQDWFEKVLTADMSQLDPSRTVVALDSLGYDWTKADAKGPGHADTMVFYDAISWPTTPRPRSTWTTTR